MAYQTVVVSERIDRNGTKHQVVIENCSRCGGAGGHEMWRYTGRTCYKCGGDGKQQGKRKIYTPEHEEKLRKQREKREEKKRQERIAKAPEFNAEKLEQLGYHTGKIFSLLGDTFQIKDELKDKGARWGGRTLGWYFPKKLSEYEMLELDVSELIEYNLFGEVQEKHPEDYRDYVNGLKKNLEPESNWVGEVGKRQDFALTILSSFEIETQFGWSCINTLKDDEGNKFVWKTQHDLVYTHGKGETIKLKGTVKEHSEYRDEKQTILTRCKIHHMKVEIVV
ncbi:hypothetical protein [Bacillus pumilus]|uniref:hypothetical protein n=1 Tax=Bacillus pumilus TaxID=1408 RepID=UPI002FE24AE5